MIGARVTGTFDLSDYEVKGRERHEIIQNLLFKISGLYAKEKERKAVSVPNELQQQAKILDEDFGNLKVRDNQAAIDGQPNKKRKPQGTLVNPYFKKRKVAGAKF